MAEHLILISPRDLDDPSDIKLVGAGKDQARRVWLPAPGFGAFLKRKREELNLSLRKAGERIGISHTYLAQIEQGDGSSHLSLDQYVKIADAYLMDDREVLHRAGCRYAVAEEVAEDLRGLEEQRFRRILTNVLFRPQGFTDKHLDLFPPAVRKFIIDLVQNIDHLAREDGPTVTEIMDAEDEE